MLDCLGNFMKRVMNMEEYLDKLCALHEYSFDGVLNLGGLRVITVVCEYVVNNTAQELTRTKREL